MQPLPGVGEGKSDSGKAAPPSSAGSATLSLSAQESEVVRRLAAQISYGPADQPGRFCEEAALAAAALPRRVRKRLGEFARNGSASGILVVRGLPVGRDLPATPPDNSHHVGERMLTARAQAIFNHAIGEMVAFEAEGHGRLFQDMVPSRQEMDAQTSLSSRTELELHTEQAFSPLRPDWISLACVKGARDAATYVMSARALSGALSSREVELLRQPLWTTGVDESFRGGGEGLGDDELRGPFAILSGSEEDPFVRFDQDLDWGVSREAERLRQRVIELYPLLRSSHTLSPGELLLVDNHRAVHGRSSFAARFDGTDRFVIRSFVVRDLAKSRHARPRNGRAIGAEFS
jgi:L-asparagine oxygenase